MKITGRVVLPRLTLLLLVPLMLFVLLVILRWRNSDRFIFDGIRVQCSVQSCDKEYGLSDIVWLPPFRIVVKGHVKLTQPRGCFQSTRVIRVRICSFLGSVSNTRTSTRSPLFTFWNFKCRANESTPSSQLMKTPYSRQGGESVHGLTYCCIGLYGSHHA